MFPEQLLSNALSLETVDVSGNNLTAVPPSLLGAEHFWLKNLHVGSNPLHCDCALSHMVELHKQSIVSEKLVSRLVSLSMLICFSSQNEAISCV